ncbi:hypothetical protein TSUD_243740 [Trifolium subterraneum]|uniref:Protein FAR1-RELATED SEQUENCE n=1 Tax=Trifolium subterraneum TaxID=3900 RepID=A0A2Z6PIU1_TRISU|nr:hypothetical protein TSUD_243740 [Trifolium subterraneum]
MEADRQSENDVGFEDWVGDEQIDNSFDNEEYNRSDGEIRGRIDEEMSDNEESSMSEGELELSSTDNSEEEECDAEPININCMTDIMKIDMNNILSRYVRSAAGEIVQKTFLCSREGYRESNGLTLEKRKYGTMCGMLPAHIKLTEKDVQDIESHGNVEIKPYQIIGAMANSAGDFHKYWKYNKCQAVAFKKWRSIVVMVMLGMLHILHMLRKNSNVRVLEWNQLDCHVITLCVLVYLDIDELPKCLVLPRWTKIAKDSIIGSYPGGSLYWDSQVAARYSSLVKMSKDVAELVYDDLDDYNRVVDVLHAELKCLKAKHHGKGRKTNVGSGTMDVDVLDPPQVKTNGCGSNPTPTPSNRIRGPTCGGYGIIGHNRRFCPNANTFHPAITPPPNYDNLATTADLSDV